MGVLNRRPRNTRHAAILCTLSWLALCAMATTGAAEPPQVKRVLLLHQELASRPFRARFNATFVDALRAGDTHPVDIFEEAIEPERFGTGDQPQLITSYLKDKYAQRNIDVLVVVGIRALEYAHANRAIFGNPAIVAVVPRPDQISAHRDEVTGLYGGWIDGTLDLALALRPGTERVFVIDGSRNNNGDLQAEIERRLNGRRLGIGYLRDLPLDELLTKVAAIPEHSIVLFVRQTIRNESQDLDPFDALGQVVRVSPAPVFSSTKEYLGRGVVGGYMWRLEDDARRMAAMARQIIGGTPLREIPPAASTYARLLDWQQLRRWNIPERLVPAGSIVSFRPQSFFEMHKEYVVGGTIVFFAQVALIISLLAQRVRRRRAEDQTRSSEARYRSVVDNQTEMICRFLPDSTLTFVNDAYCRDRNRTREELIGTRFIDSIPVEAHADVLARIGAVRRGGHSHEHSVTRADGSVGWHHWINHAILDGQGELVELQGVGRDITDQKRAELALRQVEARNSAILRAIPDLMFVLTRNGTYVDYHARDRRLLFAPPEQFIGRTVRDILPRVPAEILMGALERAAETDDPVVIEYELALDPPRYFEARLVRFEDGRILSIVRDLTESKHAIELNRTLAGRLITSQEAERARIARDLHDGVCQEMASVTVDLSYLRHKIGELETGPFQELLHSVEQRSANVAETLRLLSHGLHPTVLHHIGLIAALQADCVEVERQYQMVVTLNLEDDVEPVPPLVALSLFRIAQEALRNAARHARAPHATVSISRDPMGLTLTVTDDGDGFDIEQVRQNGGLGLVSIEERARLVRGGATFHSHPGVGTIIVVRIPVDGSGLLPALPNHTAVVRQPADGPTHRSG
jgi:PAS domain S-box-containing protein